MVWYTISIRSTQQYMYRWRPGTTTAEEAAAVYTDGGDEERTWGIHRHRVAPDIAAPARARKVERNDNNIKYVCICYVNIYSKCMCELCHTHYIIQTRLILSLLRVA